MRFLLMMGFLAFSLQNASALQKITKHDYQDIQAQIDKKKTAEKKLEAKRLALDQAAGDAILERTLKLEISSLEKERKAAYEQAMWRTIRACDIIPIVGNDPVLPYGDSVERSKHNGQRVTWVPIFDEIGVKPRQDEFGNPAAPKEFLPRNAGNTASDGVSRLFPGAFDNPSALASYVVHEVRHFWQMTTPGKGDKMTAAELEVEAYEEELALLNDPDNPLGYTAETRGDQLAHLTEMLEGDGKGNPGFKKKAAKERADANRNRGGRPLPGLSIVSFSAAQIVELVEQAKAQIVIAQRDHELRLINTEAALAVRACANPGTLTQQVLDGLPRAHDLGYKQNLPAPRGLDNCAFWVYMDIWKGASAERIKSKYLTRAPIAVPAPPPPTAAPQLPLLSGIYPELAEFAVAACRDPYRLPRVNRWNRQYSETILKGDADLRKSYTAGMDKCGEALFMTIIIKTRVNDGRLDLTDEWVRDVVASNTPKAETPPGDAAPPDAVPPGVRPPPDQVHPIIPIPGDPWKPRKVKHDSANK